MSIRDQQREKAVALLAEHLLETGLASISLRQLAQAAAISDRMLLYYFPDKSAVLAAALGRVAEGLTGQLEQAFPAGMQLAPRQLLVRLAGLTGQAENRPVMRLWVEVVAAARREEPFTTIAAPIMNGFRQWIAARLDCPPGDDRDALAAAILAMVDGLSLIEICSGEAVAASAVRGLDLLLGESPVQPDGQVTVT